MELQETEKPLGAILKLYKNGPQEFNKFFNN